MTTRMTPAVDGEPRLVLTDGGPHPAEVWGQLTAEHIVRVGPDLTGARRAAAMMLQARIMEALTPHHAAVQDAERDKLRAGAARLAEPLDPKPHLEAALAAIVTAAKGTEWEAHFGDTGVLDAIRQEMGAHFATVQHIERSWHADRNPMLPESVAWRQQRHPGPSPISVGA